MQGNELGVLPADFKNCIRHATLEHRSPDEHRPGLVRGNFVVNSISPNELADKLSPATRRANAANVQPVAPLLLDILESLRDNLDGPALSARVYFGNQISLPINGYDVGGDAADIDAHIRIDWLLARAGLVLAGRISQQHNIVHVQRLGCGELPACSIAGRAKLAYTRQYAVAARL